MQEPTATYPKLEAELAKAIKGFGLQCPNEFRIKCIQLYEMTTVRHGMMLVGPSGGGKSCVLRSLQKAVSEVKDEPGFDKARVYKLNPKSITMNQV